MSGQAFPDSCLSDGQGLTLRAMEPEDIAWLYRWENDPVLWPYGSSRTPYSRYTLKRYVERAAESDFEEMKQLRLMVCSDGLTVGAVDLYDYDAVNRRAALGILITENQRQQGLGRRTIGLMCRYAREMLGLHQLYAETSETNLPGIKLFARCGFARCASLQDWQKTADGYVCAAVWQKILD